MRVCDVHTHVFPDPVAARAVGGLVEAGGLKPHYNGTVEGLLADMDRTGVSVSVLCPVATKPSQVRSINDWTASLASDRLVPFGSVHPAYDALADEVERIAELGMRGIKLHPDFQGFDPNDERMQPAYRAATRLGLPVLFHAGQDPNYEDWYGTPEAFRKLIAEHPDMTVILAHMGGYRMWEDVAEHILGEHVYLDTAYTFGHLPAREYAELVRGHGADRVLFGSDGPWTDAAAGIEALEELGLPKRDVERILWDNAAELLGLER